MTELVENSERTVKLVSQEGEAFEVSLAVARMSTMVKDMLGDDADMESEIPLPNVHSNILIKVIEFCGHYLKDPMEEIEKPLKTNDLHDLVQRYYADFTTKVDQDTLFQLLLAANYMTVQPLLDLTCATLGCMIKDKSVDELRKIFNIVNDFTPEEEAQIKEDAKWCEDA